MSGQWIRGSAGTLMALAIAVAAGAQPASLEDGPRPGQRPAAEDAMARRLAQQLSTALHLPHTLAADAVSDWGVVDLDGSGHAARLVSYVFNKDGILALLDTAPAPAVRASIKLGQPIVRVNVLPLIGDATKQVCARTAPDEEDSTARRLTAVLAYGGGKFRTLWTLEDKDDIANNPDTKRERHATLSEVKFEEGKTGKPGAIVVNVSKFRVPPGQDESATEEVGREVHRYVFNPASGKLAEVKPLPGDMPEPAVEEPITDTGDQE